MTIGLSMPLPAYTIDPAFIGKTAEALGFDSIWYAEHPAVPVESSSPFPATGGSDAETIRNAILRGPQQLYARDRVVTVQDFEICARELQAVARAQAAAKSEVWAHGLPGTVSIALVPEVEWARERGHVTRQELESRQTDLVPPFVVCQARPLQCMQYGTATRHPVAP